MTSFGIVEIASLDEAVAFTAKYRTDALGGAKFQVTGGGGPYSVNLRGQSCTCTGGRFGLICKHVRNLNFYLYHRMLPQQKQAA